MTSRLATLLIGVLLLCSNLPASAQTPTTEMTVISTHSHDPSAFTQGLEMHDGFLYESTGLYGNSSLRQVDPVSGEVLRITMLGEAYFGEGLTIVNDSIYVLTWKQGKALVFDIDSFNLVANFSYSGEGWGLCFDGTHLVMSNGTSELSFRNPTDFSTVSTVKVRDGGVEVDLLNELECVGETVYANVWGSDLIVAIEKSSGTVIQTIDASFLSIGEPDDPNAVLNGIAYVVDSDAFLLTGKNWSSMHLVNLESEEQVNESESNSLVMSIMGTIWPVLLFAALIIFLSSMRLLGTFMQFLILLVTKRQTEQPRAISKVPPREAEEQ
ncbi:MAG: glutaminyl-peptide cyclotransferase [Candidatus Thermoplasmatota archaeon]|nr:glutaminyl-peptide cyclotransferase [Candidatus Thermoplasmatota archaeon]